MALAQRRPTDELIVLYLLEAFLRRLAASPHRDAFVLKGGVLLVAYGDRQPTRDVDVQARRLDNDIEAVTATVRAIASTPDDDGIVFDAAGAVSEVIRGDDGYQGIRVRMDATLDRARPRFAVDVSVGDPIVPAPQQVQIPALLGGPPVQLLGYPLPMVLAEKIVTALQRGSANTRWRDFADLWTLSRTQDCDGTDLQASLATVAAHRLTPLEPLGPALDGYASLAQGRWALWHGRQHLTMPLPQRFGDLLADLDEFLAPPLSGVAGGLTWCARPGPEFGRAAGPAGPDAEDPRSAAAKGGPTKTCAAESTSPRIARSSSWGRHGRTVQQLPRTASGLSCRQALRSGRDGGLAR